MSRYLKIVFLILIPALGYPQTIQFSIYVEDELTASQESDMQFDQVVSGQGLTQINPGDAGMGVFSITGNEDLDVIVTLDAPAQLTNTTSPSDIIPITEFSWAYQNNGAGMYNINRAKIVPGNSARFQMKERTGGPPGPPPTPQRSNYTPTDVTAYIFVFGAIDVGDVPTGLYAGTVTLTVEYD